MLDCWLTSSHSLLQLTRYQGQQSTHSHTTIKRPDSHRYDVVVFFPLLPCDRGLEQQPGQEIQLAKTVKERMILMDLIFHAHLH